ncbi:MAG: MFS transporter [Burkholderiaceae bacterium]|nr:MFS transporter [Burkholderiaceae bacterium]
MVEGGSYLEGRTALRVVAVFAAAYFLSYALRAINAVIAPALMTDLDLSNADLGLLSSAYFVGFGCMQLPIGVWLDRYGARRIESALLLFAALGAAIFASSSSLAGLWCGRALIGVGVSACLMAALKAYRGWYAPERQSQLASWMLVSGTIGALSSTVPVAMLLPRVGWRMVFWGIALALLAAALLVFTRLRDVERAMAAGDSAAAPGDHGYAEIFRDPYFRRMAVLGAVHQGGFMAIQSLWAGPWMVTVLGMSVQEASRALFAFNFCLMLSYLGLSWWAPRHVAYGKRPGLPVLRVVAIGLAGSVFVQCLMILLPFGWSWLLWIVFGLMITVTTLAQTHVSLAFPPSLAGRANSAFNLTLFIGAFSVQWGIGLLIDLFAHLGLSAVDAMRLAMACYVVLQTAALAMFLAGKNRTAPALSAALP